GCAHEREATPAGTWWGGFLSVDFIYLFIYFGGPRFRRWGSVCGLNMCFARVRFSCYVGVRAVLACVRGICMGAREGGVRGSAPTACVRAGEGWERGCGACWGAAALQMGRRCDMRFACLDVALPLRPAHASIGSDASGGGVDIPSFLLPRGGLACECRRARVAVRCVVCRRVGGARGFGGGLRFVLRRAGSLHFLRSGVSSRGGPARPS
ncbi:hypothetical protein B0H11DRAFT_2349227, partial [Mycena galericulata]